MSYRIGFIGYGNMAKGIINGILNSGISYKCLNICDIDRSKTQDLKGVKKVAIYDDSNELINGSDIVFLCVKPNTLADVLKSVKCENKAFISIAAGVKLNRIKSSVSGVCRYMRIMPNMPLKVGEGAICIADNHTLNKDEYDYIKTLFSYIGKVVQVDERSMDAVTAISGSGPAYVFYILDAIAKAGESVGLDYATSLELAKQTFIGSIKMIDDNADLDQLCDSICSKGGTTIEAINTFDDFDMKEIIKKGIVACKEKSVILSEKY